MSLLVSISESDDKSNPISKFATLRSCKQQDAVLAAQCISTGSSSAAGGSAVSPQALVQQKWNRPGVIDQISNFK